MKKEIKGDFVYEDESKTKVIFKPNENGKFTIKSRNEGETTYEAPISAYKGLPYDDPKAMMEIFSKNVVADIVKEMKQENEVKK